MAGKALVTLKDHILSIERRLKRAGLFFGHGTDNARDEAVWLVMSGLGLPLEEVDAQLERELSDDETRRIELLASERITTRKPLAYLLHEAWFAGLRFYVDERVIVPRSHLAEFIQEQFQPWIAAERVTDALDLCTGSGCIAIALAFAFPDARIDAVDISDDALAVAQRNLDDYQLRERVALKKSDLFAALAGKRYDLIVSNPPYVDQASMETLPAEYGFEPELALVSGESGLNAILRILADAPSRLKPGGILVAEVGNSAETLQAHLRSVPFTWLCTSYGDESVFLLTAEQLESHHGAIAAALAV